jgi:hypothetical protein
VAGARCPRRRRVPGCSAPRAATSAVPAPCSNPPLPGASDPPGGVAGPAAGPGPRSAGPCRPVQPQRQMFGQQPNRSSTSSTAAASSRRTVASNVAVLRGSARPLSSGALPAQPYRASVATRLTGTACTCAAPAPMASTSLTRARAFDMARPESLRGAMRSRSSSETFLPSGTSSRSRSRNGSSTCKGRRRGLPGSGRWRRPAPRSSFGP